MPPPGAVAIAVAITVGSMAVVAIAVGSIAVGAIIAVGTEVEGTVVLVVDVPPQAVISMAAMTVTGSNPAFLPIHLLFENIFFPPDFV
jgi:hypothetical protein